MPSTSFTSWRNLIVLSIQVALCSIDNKTARPRPSKAGCRRSTPRWRCRLLVTGFLLDHSQIGFTGILLPTRAGVLQRPAVVAAYPVKISSRLAGRYSGAGMRYIAPVFIVA